MKNAYKAVTWEAGLNPENEKIAFSVRVKDLFGRTMSGVFYDSKRYADVEFDMEKKELTYTYKKERYPSADKLKKRIFDDFVEEEKRNYRKAYNEIKDSFANGSMRVVVSLHGEKAEIRIKLNTLDELPFEFISLGLDYRGRFVQEGEKRAFSSYSEARDHAMKNIKELYDEIWVTCFDGEFTDVVRCTDCYRDIDSLYYCVKDGKPLYLCPVCGSPLADNENDALDFMEGVKND